LKQWHGFILFNPGCGHDNLSKSWKPTLGFLNKTKRPLIVTAHSTLDAQRDLKVFQRFKTAGDGGERNMKVSKYQINPWASRMMYLDPIQEKEEMKQSGPHWVRPNHSVLVL
jgi:hypothetical protein